MAKSNARKNDGKLCALHGQIQRAAAAVRLVANVDRSTAGSQVEQSRGRQHRIAQRLELQPLPVHPPEKLVRRVARARLGTVGARLLISSGKDDLANQPLGRPAVRHQRVGQPVQQLGMRRSRGSRAEVAGRGDQATAQQVPPHPVDPDSSRERIVLAGNGPGQLVTTAAIDKRIGVRPSQQRQEPPGHLFARLFGLAATENTRRGGLVGIVEDPGHWWGGGIVGPVLDRLLELVMLGPALAVKQVFDIARRAIVERRQGRR